ncbi:MAG TPA: MFS transporter [Gammaproteobacteria bacterium]
MKQSSMSPIERRTAISLAGIYAFRMMGLFLILPVFSLYAETLDHHNPVLTGLAIGIYGLTQVLFQIPFGMLSDRFGRKPIIILGLLLFALGSVVAANSTTITGIIIGRAIQGSGAIAAVVMALAADLTREDHRTKVMAMIGVTIGISFAASLVLGPLLNSWIGVPGIFWLTSVLAISGIVLLKYGVPDPEKSVFHRDAEPVPGYFSSVLRDTQLLRLDGGIFILHMILTSSFIVIPFAMRDYAGIQPEHHWYVYFSVLLLSMVVIVPFILLAEKRRQIKEVFVGAILILGLALTGLMLFYQYIFAIFLFLLLFFIAINVLEALLPSLIVKFCPAEKKGTAMGVYSTSQFLGAFAGGVAGGGIYGSYGIEGVFGFSIIMTAVWVFLAKTMEKPQYLSGYMIKVGTIDASQASLIENRLKQQAGVAEATVNVEDGVAYLKVDSRVADTDDLHTVVADLTNLPAPDESPGLQRS